MEFNKENRKFIAGVVCLGVVLYVCLQHLTEVGNFFGWIFGLISPFLIGACIAFIVNVPMRAIERRLFRSERAKNSFVKKLARPVSLVLTLLLVVAAIVLLMSIVIPEIVRTIAGLVENSPAFFARLEDWAMGLSERYPEIGDAVRNFEINWKDVGEKCLDFLRQGGGNLLNSTVGVASSVIGGVVKFGVGFVFSLYILLQKEKLARQCKQLLYSFVRAKWVDRFLGICRMADGTFSHFLSGQCVEAMILGLMFVVSMSILGFPYAMLIGVLIAFLSLIPIFGAFVGCFIGAFLILVNDPVRALWFVVLFLILQQIEGNLIYPHVVGSSVGLPSIWVLMAVTLGGSLMGVAGMLVFIPLCSVLYALLRETVCKRLRERKVPAEKWK